MSRLRTLTCSGVAILLLGAGVAMAQTESPAGALYDVTITNLTHGQIFSPPLVVSHRDSFHVFSAGTPASDELAALAEDGDSADLIALLKTEPEVRDVNVGGGAIMPGDSLTVTIELGGGARSLTVLGMLVTTNDSFFSGRARIGLFRTSFDAPAYDAGSEANTQLCDHIPGPPCGNPYVQVTEGAEGFISISSGIRDEGDLNVALNDWRNPTARIVVTRAGQ